MIRVGLVGFGLAGKVFHAPLISAVEGLQLAAVVERSARNAEAAYPGIVTCASLEAMLDDTALELIVVATPDNLHVAHARQALEAGRHVVVDKPVAATAKEIDGLMASAAKVGRMLIPFHNRRWDSDFRTLQKLIHEEKLGRIVSLESTFDRWRPHPRIDKWQEDGSTPGGVLTNLGTHLVDQALTLFGLPEAVAAEVGIERDGGAAIDSFTLRLHYPGRTVTLGCNYLAAQPRPRFRIRGTQGNFVKWGLDPQEDRLKAAGRVVEPNWGMEPSSSWGALAVEPPDEPYSNPGSMVTYPLKPIPGDYRLYYAGVRDALLGKTFAPVQAIDAWRTAQLLEWAIESSAERRTIVCDWSQEPN